MNENERFLVKWCEIQEDGSVKILDEQISDLLNQPMVMVAGGERTEIPKDVVLCDSCNTENPEFVETDGEYLTNAVCKDCKERFYKDLPVKSSLKS